MKKAKNPTALRRGWVWLLTLVLIAVTFISCERIPGTEDDTAEITASPSTDVQSTDAQSTDAQSTDAQVTLPASTVAQTDTASGDTDKKTPTSVATETPVTEAVTDTDQEPLDTFATESEDASSENATATADEVTAPTVETVTQETPSEDMDAALDAINVDWRGREFSILSLDSYKNEVCASVNYEGDNASRMINDAVYERNKALEKKCDLKFTQVLRDAAAMSAELGRECLSASGDFYMINHYTDAMCAEAVKGYLTDYGTLGVDTARSWWDQGTADFSLAGNIYFLCGAANFNDDNSTYAIFFNKQMANAYNIADLYDTVRNGDWTLSYFNEVIQDVFCDNGDAVWDENDTYGFVTTWEYANAFFFGSGLRYINNSLSQEAPTLGLTDDVMPKALEVLDLTQKIYHDNNATYMSPPGKENLALTAFKSDRGLFYGELICYFSQLNTFSESRFGLLPVPKYEKGKTAYRSMMHGIGSCLAVPRNFSDPADCQSVGDIVEVYAILSAKTVQPAYGITMGIYYGGESDVSEMLDIILRNRVFDLSFGLSDVFPTYRDLFQNCVNDRKKPFSSAYTTAAKRFDYQVKNFLNELEKKK